MKKTKRIVCLILAIVLIVLIISIISNKSKDGEAETNDNISETTVIKMDILNTLSNSGYVQTALEEEKELRAKYYLEETYFQTNQIIKAGKKLLKYTNGKYLKAPYDCIITEYSIPEEGEMCTNRHYLKLQAVNSLKVTLTVEEDELDTTYIGQEAQIEIETLENKKVTGYITDISNTASYSSSGSKFNVTVEFENDGEILIGMSAKCSIILEKAEGALAVASEAIKEENGTKYLKVKNEDGSSENVEVETGISNDAYTEIKSGVKEGTIVLIEEEETTTQNTRGFQRGENFDKSMQQGERPEMPAGGQMPGRGN